MASPAVTYTFANSTTADATQVNQNFTDIINGLTDGTKDLSISALTVAGTATLNGNVAIGNSTSDTLTITSVLSGSLALATTFATDIGAATVGLKSLYLGSNDSAAKSVRLIAGAVSASYTLTFPTAVAPQTGMGIISDASGVLSMRYTEKTTAKTTTYTATGDETTILCDATSASFTLTLPAAASFTGKHFYIKKTDSSANTVTVDGNASETIDGATTYIIGSQYQFIKIVCDGSNWHVVSARQVRGYVVCDTGGGRGNVSDRVRILSNRTQTGTDITVASDANAGTTFTIKSAGIYAISYTDGNGSAAFDFGIGKNAGVTTNIGALAAANRLGMGSQSGAGYQTVSWSGILAVNDVITPHTSTASTANNADNRTQFIIIRVGD